jgi:hypothetical protein
MTNVCSQTTAKVGSSTVDNASGTHTDKAARPKPAARLTKSSRGVNRAPFAAAFARQEAGRPEQELIARRRAEDGAVSLPAIES